MHSHEQSVEDTMENQKKNLFSSGIIKGGSIPAYMYRLSVRYEDFNLIRVHRIPKGYCLLCLNESYTLHIVVCMRTFKPIYWKWPKFDYFC